MLTNKKLILKSNYYYIKEIIKENSYDEEWTKKIIILYCNDKILKFILIFTVLIYFKNQASCKTLVLWYNVRCKVRKKLH